MVQSVLSSPCQTCMTALAADLVSAYGGMAAPNVILSYAVGLDVPITVMVDPLRIKQVVVNGLTNALKYTKAGNVVLQVRVVVGCNVSRARGVLMCEPGVAELRTVHPSARTPPDVSTNVHTHTHVCTPQHIHT
jgi:two-component system capsular synthesis sensor histidine kinase RcsC